MLRALYGLKQGCSSSSAALRRRGYAAIPVPSRPGPSFPSRRVLSEPRVATAFRMLTGGAETLSEGEKAPIPSSGAPLSTTMHSSAAIIPISTSNKMRVIVEVHTYASCSFTVYVDPNDTVGTVKTMAQKKLNIYCPDMFVYMYCKRLPEDDECTLDARGKNSGNLPYVYCNKVLEDDTSTLEECGIGDGARVFIFSRQSILLRVEVKLPGPYMYDCDLIVMARSFDTVHTLKEKIQIERDSSESCPILKSIYDKRTLDDDESLLLSSHRRDDGLRSLAILRPRRPAAFAAAASRRSSPPPRRPVAPIRFVRAVPSRRVLLLQPKATEQQGQVQQNEAVDSNILPYCSIDKKTEKKTIGELEQEFIQALQSFYYEGKAAMSNEEFDNLKEELMWEGSTVVMLSPDEQKFLEASMAYVSGKSIMTDAEFDDLKLRLKQEGSSIVQGGPRCSLRSRKVYSDLSVDYFKMFLLYVPAAVVALTLFFFLDDLTGFEITHLLELPEPFSFIFTWFAALPLIFWLSQAFTNAIVKDFLILKGACPNCGTENLSFFGTILSVPSGGSSNSIKCSNCATVLVYDAKTRLITLPEQA